MHIRTLLLLLIFNCAFIGRTVCKAYNPDLLKASLISESYKSQSHVDPAHVAENRDLQGRKLSEISPVDKFIRLNLDEADLHTLAIDLNKSVEKNVDDMNEEMFSAIDDHDDQIDNATLKMASKLQSKFLERIEESIKLITKIYSLTSSDITHLTSQLESVSALPIEVEFTTTSATTTQPPPKTEEALEFPANCVEAFKFGKPTGTTTIRTGMNRDSQKVWCDQEIDGGGWTVILRRQPQIKQIDFKRNWDSYVEGFGDPMHEYWIGLEMLYQLTKRGSYQLRVELQSGNETGTATYNTFRVASSAKQYKLRVGGYNESISTAGNAMRYHNGKKFTTFDVDNDGASGGNCANWSGGGGWWYDFCFMANPTGLYPTSNETSETDKYLEWRTWQGHHIYLSHLLMMIRRSAA